jgi:hypothetical protein
MSKTGLLVLLWAQLIIPACISCMYAEAMVSVSFQSFNTATAAKRAHSDKHTATKAITDEHM